MPSGPSMLQARLTARRWAPAHVAEVGVWSPETSVAAPWAGKGRRITLVEPDPEAAAALRARFGADPGVTIHEVAVAEVPGRVVLYRRGASTFLSSVTASPAAVNDGYAPRTEDRLEVPAVTFAQLDDGSIDLLAVDVEGAEWFVIRALKSRPGVIAVETHGAAYVNPHIGKIRQWMREHGYVPWLITRSDTVFVRPDQVRPTALDRVRLGLAAARLAFRAVRKRRRAGRRAV